jgi:coiled-coil domain-containing protein 55
LNNTKITTSDILTGPKEEKTPFAVTTEAVKKEEIMMEKPEPPKPKIDIWKKQTVGEVYDLALQKYYERKALKESQKG